MHCSKIWVASLVLLLFLTLSGCNGPYSGRRADAPPVEQTESLVYLDAGLVNDIPCQSIKAEQLPSGRIRVYARFLNQQDDTVETKVRIKFTGSNGHIVDQTNWMPLLLPRREITEFVHTSLATGATDFTLLLRLAR